MSRSSTGTYRIGAVSKLTGLSTHTIRVWERRYGAVDPQRTPGGTREYSDEDLDRLVLLNTLSQSGHAIGRIAHLATPELIEMLGSARERGLVDDDPLRMKPAVIETLLAAILEMDIVKTEQILLDTAAVIGPLAMVFDVVAPLVEAIGTRWASGEFRIAHEHAATASLRALLGHFLSNRPARRSMPVAIAATMSGERHELGALMAAFVAVTRGYHLVYLGPDLPDNEILHAVDTKEANLLLLSIVNERNEESAQMLGALKANLPSSVRLLVGGRSADAYSDLISPDERVASLRDLYERLEDTASPMSRTAGSRSLQ